MNQLLKLLIAVLIFAGTGVYAQCPENIGFEDGTFKNWKAYIGEVERRTGVITLDETSQPPYSRFQIMSAANPSEDPYGHFPTVSPNGSKYAVRLGDADTGRRVDRLTYTFTVPQSSQYGLVLNYAVVLQNPDHIDSQQPRFTVKAFNVTDNKDIECPEFDFIAKSGLPGFKLSDVTTSNPRPGGGTDVTSIYYKDWASTTINLLGYAGKTIQLIFTTNDCNLGGHFGYAYFDINEQCNSPITGNTYCEGQNVVTLKGPRGFNKYKWYNNSDPTTVLDTAQTLTISPAPPDGTQYRLIIDALPGLGCTDTLYTVVNKSSTPFTFNVTPVKYFCPGTTFNLTTADITSGSSPGLLPLEYYIDPVSEEYLRDPDKISQPGIYYIKAANAEGCANTLAIELRFYDAVVIPITQPPPVQYPATIDLRSAYERNPVYTYSFYSDANLTKKIDNSSTISVTGRYYVKAVSPNGCEKAVAINAVINPPPPNIISGPTVFTPNNDGINDHFNITIKGFVDFGTLSIYNRAGQFLFKTSKQATAWDGSFNGRTLPSGTYYWLFEGTDQYYHTKINKGGSVTIIK
jgi:gliding motility-associated-like protein